MAWLEILDGRDAGHRYPLNDTVSLGRSADNTIRLSDPQVSRQHARVLQQGEQFVLENLRAVNGTTVRGTPLPPHTPTPLHDGDEISLGPVRLRFHAQESPTVDPTPPLSSNAPIAEARGPRAAPPGSTVLISMPDEEATGSPLVTLEATQSITALPNAEPTSADVVQQTLHRFHAMCELSIALGGLAEHEAVLDTTLDWLFAQFPRAERAFVLLTESTIDTLVPVATRQRAASPSTPAIPAISRTIVREVLQHKRAVLSYDALDDPQFSAQTSIIEHSIRSVMSVPLLVGTDVLGLLQVDSPTTQQLFTPDDLHLLLGLASQVAIALHNTQLVAVRERAAALETAKNAAEAANRFKSTFLANMSHELRTPMTAIIGYCEMLIENAEDCTVVEAVADLEKILGAAHHLLALINDILDLSKIEAGKMDLHLEYFPIQALIDEVVATVQPLVAAHANVLDVHVATPVPPLYTDRTKVRQCLLNLLSNACKFTEQGTIRLEVVPETMAGHDGLTLYVHDTGIGITPEQQANLFQRFAQADTSSTRQHSGTGLGLALTKRFCQMMGGEVMLTSTPGQGSTFTLWLPLNPPGARRPLMDSGDGGG